MVGCKMCFEGLILKSVKIILFMNLLILGY